MSQIAFLHNSHPITTKHLGLKHTVTAQSSSFPPVVADVIHCESEAVQFTQSTSAPLNTVQSSKINYSHLRVCGYAPAEGQRVAEAIVLDNAE